MGTLAFALVLLGLLWLATTDARLFCLAVFALAGLPMEVVTSGQRFLSGPLEVDAQALYMFVVLTGCGIAIALRTGRAVAALTRVPALAVFLAAAAASLAWTDNPVYGLRMLVKLLTPVAFLWLVYLVAAENLRARNVATAIYVSAALLLVLALVNLLSHGALGPLGEVAGLAGLPQLAAPYSSPSNFSFALSVAALLAYARWSEGRRAVHLLLAAVLLAAIAFALCRAAILGLLVGFVVYAAVGRPAPGRRLLLAAVGAAVVFATLFSVPEFRHRMFFDSDALSWGGVLENPGAILDHLDTSGRDGLWSAAREDFRDRSAWVGSGIGSVDRWIRDRDVRGAELHSDVFRLYLDLGIVGLGLFAAALLSLARRILRVQRGTRRGGPEGFPVERVALGALACYVATLPTDNSLNYVANFGVLVFGLAGLALARAGERQPAVEAARAPAPARRFAQILD